MASLAPPLRVCRGILKEIRALKGPDYQRSPAYSYVLEQFRKNQVTSEKLCRAQQESLHTASSYLSLLASSRLHSSLHSLYHRRGEQDAGDTAAMLGFRLPAQPGGKGWEE
ncbi:protein FMC1 homolog [Amia ocellicauda]|uniref:protein FMC1 homolog n=1 Tax=Amia ocellicauda TaxID=2972642 RepID=UPI0034643F9C